MCIIYLDLRPVATNPGTFDWYSTVPMTLAQHCFDPRLTTRDAFKDLCIISTDLRPVAANPGTFDWYYDSIDAQLWFNPYLTTRDEFNDLCIISIDLRPVATNPGTFDWYLTPSSRKSGISSRMSGLGFQIWGRVSSTMYWSFRLEVEFPIVISE